MFFGLDLPDGPVVLGLKLPSASSLWTDLSDGLVVFGLDLLTVQMVFGLVLPRVFPTHLG